jgi:hypothetical protein
MNGRGSPSARPASESPRRRKPRAAEKRPRDPAQPAKFVVDVATGEIEDREPTPEEQGESAAAVELGRRGGLKGGKARAAILTKNRRTIIAKKGAEARWKKDRESVEE